MTSPFTHVVNTDNCDISNCMSKYSMMKQSQVPKKKKMSEINKTIMRLYNTSNQGINVRTQKSKLQKHSERNVRREIPHRKFKLSTQSLGEGLRNIQQTNGLASTCRSISSISQGTEEM